MKNLPDFGRLQTSTANISGMDEYIQNRPSASLTAIPPAFGKGHVNFGPLIAEISMWNHTHPSRLVRKTIFWLLSGTAHPNF